MQKIQRYSPKFKEDYYFRTRNLVVENDSFHIYTFFESEYKPFYGNTPSEESNFYNLFLVCDGVFECISPNGERYILSPGSIVLSSARKNSSCRAVGNIPCKRKCFLFFKTAFTRKLISCFFPNEEFCCPAGLPEAALLISRLQEEFCKEDTLEKSPHLLGIFTELLELVRTAGRKKEFPDDFLQLLSFVEGNLYDPALKRETIAVKCSVSLSSLDRLFLKYVKKTASAYIQEKRFAKVESLLAIPEIRIKTLAASCGFSSAIHMNFLFRKKYGMTPTQYRKKILLTHAPFLRADKKND